MAESADHVRTPEPEWSYKVNAEDIEASGKTFTISPDEQQVKDMCTRLDLLAIEHLEAMLHLTRKNKRIIHIAGSFKGRVIQKCVVSLEPVPAEIGDRFESWFADPNQAVSFARALHEKDKFHDEESLMLDESEDPEPIIDGKIDLGELVTQFVSLALDPYPRSAQAGAVMEEANDALPKKQNPFAALKDLKNKE